MCLTALVLFVLMPSCSNGLAPSGCRPNYYAGVVMASLLSLLRVHLLNVLWIVVAVVVMLRMAEPTLLSVMHWLKGVSRSDVAALMGARFRVVTMRRVVSTFELVC